MNEIFTHSFIGIGKMAQVILEALLKHPVDPKKIIVSRRSLPALKKIKKTYRVAITTDNREAAAHIKYIWLGIKPQQALEILKEIKPFLSRSTVIISMMAGVSTKTIHKVIGHAWPVVRLMPNTPAKLGRGATGVYFTKKVSDKVKKQIIFTLDKLGMIFPIKRESDFNAVTGLSGSGPAFVYKIAQGLIAGGVESGLTQRQARELTIATLQGATAMLAASEMHPETLIENVASKKGTTEAGLKVLQKYRTAKAMELAVKAAAKRSLQITSSLESNKKL